MWGKDAWKKVVVCIVADGRTKYVDSIRELNYRIHERTLASLGLMGVYQDGIAKNTVEDKPVTAHVFEYTAQITIDSSLKIR